MSSRALIRVLSQIFCCFGAFYLVRAENTTVQSNISEIKFVLCPKNARGQTCDDIIDPVPTLITCEDLTQNQGYDCRGCRCGAPKTTTVINTTNATNFLPIFVTNATIVEPRIPSNCTFDFETAPNSTLVSLFLLPILWVLLICLATFADIFLKCCCDKKVKKASTDEDEDEDDGLSLRARAEKTVFEYSHLGKMLFFSVKRSWQEFNKRNQPPPKPEDPIRFSYGLEHQVYRVLSGSAIIYSWRAAVMTACLAGLFMWGLLFMREMDKCYPKPDKNTPSELEILLEHIQALSQLTKGLEKYVVFMLIFYVRVNVQNWNRCFTATRTLRDELTNFALGIATIRPSFHPFKRQKYNIYRYLNVVHFYCYANLLPEFRKEKNVHTMLLQSGGLLSPDEKRRLDNSEDPADMAHRWLVRTISTLHLHFREKNFLIKQLNTVVNELQSVRGAVNAYPPLSFVQIMKMLIDLYLFFLPIVFVSDMYMPDEPFVQLMPCLACLLVSFAYQGLMAMVDILKNPFGDSPDQFDINTILLELDRKVYDILVHDSGKHFYGRELARVKRRYDRNGLIDPEHLHLKFLVEDVRLWEEIYDEHHNQYFYYNNSTKESTWTCPSDPKETFEKKIPANQTTADFMTRYDAVVRLQSNFRRALTKEKLKRSRPDEQHQDDDGD